MTVRGTGFLVAAIVVAAASLTPSAAVRPPKLQYDISTLLVHLQIWYHVGSKNEKKGRTGFAHLFEHLMFKGSKNVGPEEHTSMMTGLGGQSNAYTTDDETVF